MYSGPKLLPLTTKFCCFPCEDKEEILSEITYTKAICMNSVPWENLKYGSVTGRLG